MNNKIFYLGIILLAFANIFNAQSVSIDYFGQKKPGYYPEKFAEGILIGGQEYIANFSSDGKEFYFPAFENNEYTIKYMELKQGVWSERKTASFCEDSAQEASPSFSPDGKRLYYTSNRKGGIGNWDIYYVERTDKGWSAPINPGTPVNSSAYEDYPFLSKDGKFYFNSQREDPSGNIYQATYINGKFENVVSIGDSVNSKAYEEGPVVIGDKLFFTDNKDYKSNGDINVCYRIGEKWSKPEIITGGKFKKGMYFGFRVTPDEEYFLFMRNSQMYWVNVEVMDYLGVKEAPFDYITGWYAGDSSQMKLALHPKLLKRRVISTSEVQNVTYDWMINAVIAGWTRIDNIKQAQKDIQILDQTEDMASIKVISNDFVDYLHLAKFDNQWKIVNALWEYKKTADVGTKNEVEQLAAEYINSWKSNDKKVMGSILLPDFGGRMALSLTEVENVDYNWMTNKMHDFNNRMINKLSNINVKVLDISKNMASVKIENGKFVEYLHLSHIDNKWYIVNSIRNFKLISNTNIK
jgi:hypothetical protein